jgi:hypothetical protein
MRRVSAGLLRWPAVLIVGVLIGVAAGGIVASRAGATLPNAVPARQTIRVEAATLERLLRYPATAEWTATGVVYAPSGGLVTQIVTPSGVFHSGDVILRVDERPMVVIPGEVPAFRAMTVGSRGRDVRALQDYLATRGLGVNRDRNVFSTTTTAAVKAWQRSLQVEANGSVALGDLLIVDPAAFGASPLRWTDAVRVGAPIAGGTPMLERLADAPSLQLVFGGSLPPQVTEGLTGVATFPNGDKLDVVVGAITATQGMTTVEMTTPGGRLCQAADCLRLVPAAGTTKIDVVFTLVPSTTGPAVPAAAVQSAADGSSFVERAAGIRTPVRVLAASGGTVIVDGVTIGDEVVLP